MEEPLRLLREFALDSEPVRCERYGNGHINLTYLVYTIGGQRYILQKINRSTFRDVAGLMENIAHVTDYLRQRAADPRSVLTLVRTKRGESYLEHDGEAWRVYVFVEGSICLQLPKTDEDFYESAVAFGMFQQQLAQFPVHTLH